MRAVGGEVGETDHDELRSSVVSGRSAGRHAWSATVLFSTCCAALRLDPAAVTAHRRGMAPAPRWIRAAGRGWL